VVIGGVPAVLAERVRPLRHLMPVGDVDPDDPARFPTADALTHERKVCLALVGRAPTALVDRPVPELEIHRVP
jgi:hypothetical protein